MDRRIIGYQDARLSSSVASCRTGEEALRNVGRSSHPDDTVVEVGGACIGAGRLAVIAGPCAVESEEQCMIAAEAVKRAGASMFRGGAFKPRTSPYDFQGLGASGIEILSRVKREFGLPIVSEIMDARDLDLFDDVDMLQVGARNMQNFTLLKALGKTDRPVLLKRGHAATIDELLMAAEYIAAEGNTRIVLCERGIRSFDPRTRNVFDVAAVAVLKGLTHLPVIADPSHATGHAELVAPVACAAVAAGADGLEIEVHHNPAAAVSDGEQSLTPERFTRLMKRVSAVEGALSQDALL